ncbi:class D sortase [Bacillus salacetis]|uniref:class D sortase n=1 Tax=Bacillus salacetis TaxID=2315464 RepID=UPI003BA1BDED
MKKVLPFVIILIGLSVVIYPKAADMHASYKQDKLMQEWEDEMAPGDQDSVSTDPVQETAQESYINLDDVFDPSAKTEDAVSQERERASEAGTEESLGHQMLGIITIDKINVNLPILRGASQKNLKYGAGHLTGTVMPGRKGNSAIAAHRSREYGKNFNRLGEIQAGDVISVKTRGGSFQYEVTGTKIVKPSDLSVLQESDGSILTLITCDTIDNPVNRLIVKAEKL